MQLASCSKFSAAVRHSRPATSCWSGRRPSLTTTAAPPAPLVTIKPKHGAPSPAIRCHCWSSSGRDDDDAEEFSCGNVGGGRMVDEGMVVLRRRIHEMEAAERNWEPPEEWEAGWEKEWYGTYDADVCNLVGAIQGFLLSSRPAVGVGILALLAIALPASAFVVVSHLLDASRAILGSNLHH